MRDFFQDFFHEGLGWSWVGTLATVTTALTNLNLVVTAMVGLATLGFTLHKWHRFVRRGSRAPRNGSAPAERDHGD